MLSCAWKRHHRLMDSPANPKCSSCGHLREDESPVKNKKTSCELLYMSTPQKLTRNLRIHPWEKTKIIFQSTIFQVLYINLRGFEALGGGLLNTNRYHAGSWYIKLGYLAPEKTSTNQNQNGALSVGWRTQIIAYKRSVWPFPYC